MIEAVEDPGRVRQQTGLPAADADGFVADVAVIGSGFGGSTSALRLAEKGYRVLVLERGKHWKTTDFPKTNWNVFGSMWAPLLGCTGILRLTLLDDVFVLSGAGVGGGSLWYANTLLIPPERFFRDPQWAPLCDDWQKELAPHYRTAQRMLGAVPNPVFGAADEVLRDVASEMGVAHTFKATDVGVFFGKPGQRVPDPYFAGKGPDRLGCIRCGACMTGCKHGSKNTLDRNYLYLAQQLGAHITAETEVVALRALGDGTGKDGYVLTLRPSHGLGRLFGPKQTIHVRQVVCAAGVMGTLPLLMQCKEAGLLPRLPETLGNKLRTNSEAIVGAIGRRDGPDMSKGVAITSGAYFDDHTHIEVVRYGEGHDALSLLSTLLTDGGGRVPRPLRWVGTVLRHPLQFAKTLWKAGWARNGIILLVMQTLDNSLNARWKRSRWLPWLKTLRTERPAGSPANPTFIPIGNEVARRVAGKIGGTPMSSIPEVLLDIPTTAHILGGCTKGPPGVGLVDKHNRVYGYEGLWICDGSVVPANLGVNPSLTITALTEHAMSAVPPKAGATAQAPTVAEVAPVWQVREA